MKNSESTEQEKSYEPPAIEKVLKQEDIERESHYAGDYTLK